MARLLIEGVELGAMYWPGTTGTLGGNNFPGGAEGAFSGSYCGYLNGGGANTSFPLVSDKPEVYMAFKSNTTAGSHFAFKDSAGTATATVLRVASGENMVLELRLGGNTGTLLATSPGFPLTYSLFEARYKPLNSGGVVQIKRDGQMIINYSGDTTNGLENVKWIVIGSASGQGASGYYWDDLVVDDSGWIGHTRIQKVQVDGAGASTQWTPSTGNNYACVDEIPASDTDYVHTNVSVSIDTYSCAAPTGTIDSIKCLRLSSRMAYEGAPSPTKQAIVLRTNGTNYSGEDISPGAGFGNFTKIWEANPNDSQPWEEADIVALEIGVKAFA